MRPVHQAPIGLGAPEAVGPSAVMARERRSSGCSRIWRMTSRTRRALITYTLMLLMPIPCAFAPVPSVGPRVGSRVEPDVNPWAGRSCPRWARCCLRCRPGRALKR